jgi:hypothetical protein
VPLAPGGGWWSCRSMIPMTCACSGVSRKGLHPFHLSTHRFGNPICSEGPMKKLSPNAAINQALKAEIDAEPELAQWLLEAQLSAKALAHRTIRETWPRLLPTGPNRRLADEGTGALVEAGPGIGAEHNLLYYNT